MQKERERERERERETERENERVLQRTISKRSEAAEVHGVGPHDSVLERRIAEVEGVGVAKNEQVVLDEQLAIWSHDDRDLGSGLTGQ